MSISATSMMEALALAEQELEAMEAKELERQTAHREHRAPWRDPERVPKNQSETIDTDTFRTPPFHRAQPLLLLSVTLIAFLNLLQGVSRDACRTTILAITATVRLAFQFTPSGFRKPLTPTEEHLLKQFPRDLRTITTWLQVDPDIVRYISCPSCHKLYRVPLVCPDLCDHKDSERSKPCNAPLFRSRRHANGRQFDKARRLFSTQPLAPWLSRFLHRPGVEDLLDTSFTRKPPTDGRMHDIWDSPTWHFFEGPDGAPYCQQSGNLVFSLFIDGFNPLGNKQVYPIVFPWSSVADTIRFELQAGKKFSMGLILLVCMSLPPSHRYRPENLYIAGIIPGPSQPNVHQINEVLRPLVDDFKRAWTGLHLSSTFRHPRGRWISSAIFPLICDLAAVRTVGGFGAHNAKFFCTFCYLERDDIESLDHESWGCRDPETLKQQSEAYRDTKTKSGKEALFKTNSVRYSILSELKYWDPTKHIVVEPVHNNIIGLLANHGRRKLGLDILAIEKYETAVRRRAAQKRRWAEEDEEDVGMEDAEVLRDEARLAGMTPFAATGPASTTKQLRHLHTQTPLPVSFSDSFENTYDSDQEMSDGDYKTANVTRSDLSSSESDSEDEGELGGPALNKHDVKYVRKVIEEVTLPTWVTRVPQNIGEPSHGRLKADEWFILFSVHLSVALVDLWTSPQSTRRQDALLQNFHHLVSAVHLSTRYSTSNSDAKQYLDHILQYRQTIRKLWPAQNSVPNHHLAVHTHKLLERLGPTPAYSAWAGERTNGILASTHNNGHLAQADFTFLRQFCRRGNLRVLINNLKHAYPTELSDLLSPFQDLQHNPESTLYSPHSALPAALPIRQNTVPISHYLALLSRFNSEDKNIWRHFADFKRPWPSEHILSPIAYSLPLLQLSGRDYTTSQQHPGNSLVFCRTLASATPLPAQIFAIYRAGPNNSLFFVVRFFRPLQENNPYLNLPGLQATLCRNSFGEAVAIRQSEIIAHAARHLKDPGAFGITGQIAVFINLDRA
ncbi:hypothetical protein P7C70_g8067, partial [Phenoliferia sp. Uapishka_3]